MSTNFFNLSTTLTKDKNKIDEINRQIMFANQTFYLVVPILKKNVHEKTKFLLP